MKYPKHLWLAAVSAAAMALVGCGSDGGGADPGCGGNGGEGPFVPADGSTCERLSTYGMISLDEEGNVVPAEGVLPYDLNTPLFSDYAKKTRTIWVPEGTAGQYTDTGVLELPVGTVITKTFAFPADLREPDTNVDVLETRVLIRREDGWTAIPYIWNESRTEAFHTPIGGAFEVSWIHTDGSERSTTYLVPNRNQCVECHGRTDPETGIKVQEIIGPKTKHINKDFDYGTFLPGDGVQNQLERWAEEGILEGVPADPTTAARLPVFDDPADGTLDQRARAYLDANCAHCHNPHGAAEASGLILESEEDVPEAWGVCQGLQRGIGGSVSHNIVPGDVEASALHFRMDTTDPADMMPRLGRSVIHEEGVALIEEWILWLGTQEGIDAHNLDSGQFTCF